MARECGRAAAEATFPVYAEDGREWWMTPAQARAARLAFYLSLVNERHPFPFPVELVGELVGARRWAVSSIIKALERMKVIEVTDSTYKPPQGGRPGVARRVRFIGRVPRDLQPPIPY